MSNPSSVDDLKEELEDVDSQITSLMERKSDLMERKSDLKSSLEEKREEEVANEVLLYLEGANLELTGQNPLTGIRFEVLSPSPEAQGLAKARITDQDRPYSVSQGPAEVTLHAMSGNLLLKLELSTVEDVVEFLQEHDFAVTEADLSVDIRNVESRLQAKKERLSFLEALEDLENNPLVGREKSSQDD